MSGEYGIKMAPIAALGLPEVERNEKGVITNIRWNGNQGLLGYLIHIATTEPRSYVGLLGRVLPLDVNARVMRDEVPVCRNANELAAELRNRGIPIDALLTTVELRPLRSVGDDDEDR